MDFEGGFEDRLLLGLQWYAGIQMAEKLKEMDEVQIQRWLNFT